RSILVALWMSVAGMGGRLGGWCAGFRLGGGEQGGGGGYTFALLGGFVGGVCLDKTSVRAARRGQGRGGRSAGGVSGRCGAGGWVYEGSMAGRVRQGQAPGHDAEPASSEHAAPGHADKDKEDPTTYILEHVADSPEVEFQVPLSDKEFIIHFPVWRIPLKEG